MSAGALPASPSLPREGPAPASPTRSALAAPLALTVLALLLHGLPGASEALALDRGAVARGEWWRLVSGHWTHWTASQLLWDGLVFGVFGALCAAEDRVLFVRSVAASVLAVPLAVLWLEPGIGVYRGLSGVDAALCAALATASARSAWRDARLGAALGVLASVAAFAAKLAWEATTRTAFFADLGPGVVPVPLAHLVGAAAGTLAALTRPPR